MGSEPYPVRVVLPGGDAQSRWSIALRLPLALPALVFVWLLHGGAVLAVWAAVLASGRVPPWLFRFQVEVARWHVDALAYLLLVTGERPRFHRDHEVMVEIDEPKSLSRWRVAIWKLVSAVPHFVAIGVLTASLMPVAVASWVMLLIGITPNRLRGYSLGVVRWQTRLAAYVQSLTDEYPPFSLRAEAPPARRWARRLAAAPGSILAGLMVAWYLYVAAFSGEHVRVEVDYDALVAGTPAEIAQVNSGEMVLRSVTDPADGDFALFSAATGTHFVAFVIDITNERGPGVSVPVSAGTFLLVDADAAAHQPVLVGVDGTPGGGSIDHNDTGWATIVFELADGVEPAVLRWDVVTYIDLPQRGETIEWVLR